MRDFDVEVFLFGLSRCYVHTKAPDSDVIFTSEVLPTLKNRYKRPFFGKIRHFLLKPPKIPYFNPSILGTEWPPGRFGTSNYPIMVSAHFLRHMSLQKWSSFRVRPIFRVFGTSQKFLRHKCVILTLKYLFFAFLDVRCTPRLLILMSFHVVSPSNS